MLRIMHSGAGEVRFFSAEADALAWLEDKDLRE